VNTAGLILRMPARTLSRGLSLSTTKLSSASVSSLNRLFTTSTAPGSTSTRTAFHLAAATAWNLNGTPSSRAQSLSMCPVSSMCLAGRNPGSGRSMQVIVTSGGPPSLAASRRSSPGHWRPRWRP